MKQTLIFEIYFFHPDSLMIYPIHYYTVQSQMLTSFKEEFNEGFQGSFLRNILKTVLILVFLLFFRFFVPLPLRVVFILFGFLSSNLLTPHVTLFSPLHILRSPGASSQTTSNLFIGFCCRGHHLCSSRGAGGGGRGRGCGGGGGGSCCCFCFLHVIFLQWAFSWTKVFITSTERVLRTFLASDLHPSSPEMNYVKYKLMDQRQIILLYESMVVMVIVI